MQIYVWLVRLVVFRQELESPDVFFLSLVILFLIFALRLTFFKQLDDREVSEVHLNGSVAATVCVFISIVVVFSMVGAVSITTLTPVLIDTAVYVDLSAESESRQHALLHELLARVSGNVHAVAARVAFGEAVIFTRFLDVV